MFELTIVYTSLCSTNSKLTIIVYSYWRHLGFSHLRISSKKWHNHSASSSHLSSDFNSINSYFILDLAITICFEDFYETTPPISVNT